ncbi:hypothetical protein NLJ89_g4895 [Agrocybe chaxingu]|uniref:DUF6533 domain-containing protein n=1 Tax=Agrocybe chaxingu TaxID=84603 RepID=A0A9W8K216_9AGAR|nr:hypothetical protein NLJ89_g4895 [Agrocybe chaxingu]
MADIAACTVFVWDYLLTLGMEVQYVWPGRWTIIKAVYLLQRYLPFIDTLWIALHVIFGANLSPTTCTHLNAVGRSLMCLVILTFRAWAVWDRNRVLGIILQILFAACFLPTAPILYVFLKSVDFIDLPPPTEGCVPVAGKRIIIVNWALLLAWDTFILVLMAIPAFQAFRFKNNSPLYRAVYTEESRNGRIPAFIPYSIAMRRYISKEEKKIALRMSVESHLNDEEIAEYTGIRPRTMRRLRQQYRETGEIERKPVVSGRPRLLNALDATFLEALVERQPDILVSEIMEYLRPGVLSPLCMMFLVLTTECHFRLAGNGYLVNFSMAMNFSLFCPSRIWLL